jgi:hypothetical protein
MLILTLTVILTLIEEREDQGEQMGFPGPGPADRKGLKSTKGLDGDFVALTGEGDDRGGQLGLGLGLGLALVNSHRYR